MPSPEQAVRQTAMRLPNYLIVGAMRSGTTSLARYLGDHPQVFMAPKKELHFFDRHYDRGVDWYREQFLDVTSELAVGEASQTYMYDASVPPRMARLLPEARLIAILRDPADRAYSEYWFRRARGKETLGFVEAIEAETKNPGRERNGAAYIERGRYVGQLRRLCEHYQRDSLHVVLFEDLRDRSVETFSEVCRFLGIDDGYVPATVGAPINRFTGFRSLRIQRLVRGRSGVIPRIIGRLNQRETTYPPMDRAVRTQVDSLFKQDNEALASWLGRDLSAWN